MDRAGKVAVVTGGASGLGRAIVQRAVDDEMKVVIADVEESATERAVAELREAGAEVIGVHTDVSSADDVARLRDETIATFGGVHLLCNNAGIGTGTPLLEFGLERWRWMIDVNIWGLIHCCRTFVLAMIEQDEGHVVNISSLAGVIAAPNFGPYSATKAAIVGYSQALAQELDIAGSAVHVSVVCPALIKTTAPTSDRNKPAYVGEQTATEQAFTQGLAIAMDAFGMEPSTVADSIFAGMDEGRFYVFPNQAAADGAISSAVEWLQTGTAPPTMPLQVPV